MKKPFLSRALGVFLLLMSPVCATARDDFATLPRQCVACHDTYRLR